MPSQYALQSSSTVFTPADLPMSWRDAARSAAATTASLPSASEVTMASFSA